MSVFRAAKKVRMYITGGRTAAKGVVPVTVD